jgi:hypothetical protein
MIKAVLIDALSGCEDGTTAPRGGFTDVGLHTGGYERNTSWALIRAVLQALLEEQSLFYRHAMAQLALWLCEASVAALLAENTADAPYRQAIDKCMQMLSVAVQAGSRLADEQIHIRGGDHLKDDMAAFEARSVYVRWQLEQLVLRRASGKALEFELPRLEKKDQPCRNIALSPPPQTVPNTRPSLPDPIDPKMLGYPPPDDVPTSMSLCGELKHQTTCLGTYLLAPQRTAHGKPVWKHATEDKWIAWASSVGKWEVQPGANVGVNAACYMTLQDTTASLPHQSTAVWEERDGTAKQWVKAPTCKCFGDVPTSMSLCGELKHQTTCLGTYLLAPQRTAHGKPVWKHASEDRWIALGSHGIWVVQQGANVGVDAVCYMLLEDTTASLPHQSSAVWKEYDGKQFVKAPSCKCFGDVPTSMSLCGELKHMPACQGTYLLAPQRTAHGKPVWKHATADRWIAWTSTGKWLVQQGVDVGVNALGFMKLETASLPHQSTAVWEEGDGKQWAKAPTCKCFFVPEHPPDGLVAARAKAEANLGWLPDPGVATCIIVDLLSWLRDERLKPDVRGVEAQLVALEAVEHWFYQHAPKLMASDTESYEKDEAQSKQFVATVEQVVDMYRYVASAFQKSKASAALLTVERKSREVLVMWLAYCFCFKVSLH